MDAMRAYIDANYDKHFNHLQDDDRDKRAWERSFRRPLTAEEERLYAFNDACLRERFGVDKELAKKKANEEKKKKKKKKNPQKKLSAFFSKHPKKTPSSVKAAEAPQKKPPSQKNKVALNFQGFSLKRCVYRPEVGDYVLAPPDGYQSLLEEWEPVHFCSQCLLAPCLVQAKRDRITNMTAAIAAEENHMDPSFNDKPDSERWIKLHPRFREEIFGELMREIFSDRYYKKFGLPRCCQNLLNKQCPADGRKRLSLAECTAVLMESDSDDSDVEFLLSGKGITDSDSEAEFDG